ncbi:2-oxo-4-hydroxy-4-carboxy-5-ureidoimidazoline decarboxylase [Glycomyces sp. L485]|uniref:2-oxo-4-hydroxy-4-carboxy-5-ureidoimidazoline decarboxylase n=1 Tax=Glycomyces sp. L485 TaxID=2909235 RepID=UPI001F4B7C26|nr:2-oxo-4-hydroxy-4-carboxy-5-ureidoimidazoline decarboxylase [Glycomyces sp. L485]MCH7231966.1 2-oxo-4-hydroxy-4-carboxy-5-ureidoimidazoline decarboxylase [Glycomyces sp. L485]
MWTLGEFNTLDAGMVAGGLTACCASTPWVEKVTAGRPYGSVASLLSAASAAFDELDESELAVAHAAHPRIGEPASNAWSRREQSRAMTGDDAVRAALRAANEAYEHKFGRVFLIRATGRTAEEILAEARRRLDNDYEAESIEAAAQLRAIVMLRLGRAVRA